MRLFIQFKLVATVPAMTCAFENIVSKLYSIYPQKPKPVFETKLTKKSSKQGFGELIILSFVKAISMSYCPCCRIIFTLLELPFLSYIEKIKKYNFFISNSIKNTIMFG